MGLRQHLPSSASIKSFFGFIHLLLYAEPTWLDKLFLVAGVICAVGAGVPFPLVGIVFGQLVDDLNDATCGDSSIANGGTRDGLQGDINDKILLMVYIAIATLVLIYAHCVCWSLLSQRLAQRVREKYLSSLLRQDIAFFDALESGDVSSRLDGDMQAIETGTSEKVGVFLTCVSFCITAYVIAFIKDAALAGMLVSLIPAFLIMNVVGGHYIQKYSTSMTECFSKASSIASEGLSHIGLVHALGAKGRLEEKFSGYLSGARRGGIQKALATAVQAGLLYFIAFSANALAYWQGSRKIASRVEDGGGGTTVGQTYTVIFILVDGSIVLSQVAPLLPLFGSAVAAFQRLKKDIDNIPTIISTTNSGNRPSAVSGNIRFSDVSFTYPSRPEHSVLNRLSFEAEAGKMTAIVGLSGSGKSTIASLVARFYDPKSGSITLAGYDIRTLNVRQLRGYISLVPQEPSLLDRSILENIAHGLVSSPPHQHLSATLLSDALDQLVSSVRTGMTPDLDKAAAAAGKNVTEIVELARKAAEIADATLFIEKLEYGLATSVGSSGSLISGGQKQRIALARALVRDPAILVLDEATAALDSASERRIQSAIERASAGRTVISIAHRLSTIRNASKIIVMRTDNIIEEGTHEELLGREGPYAEMVRLQTVKPKEEDMSRKPGANNDGEAIEDMVEQSLIGGTEEKGAAKAVEGFGSTDANDDSDSEIPKASTVSTLMPMLRRYLLLLTLAFFAALIVGGTYPAAGAIFGNLLSSLSPCNPVDFIRSRGMLLAGMFFMLACVEFLANFTSWTSFGIIAEKTVYQVRVRSLQQLFSQSLQWHQSSSRTPTGLLGYITNDGNALASFSGSIIGTLFSVVVNFIAAIVLSHILAWRIAIVCLVVVPILLGAGFMQLRSIARFAEKHAGAFSSSIGITVEAVSHIRTVAALSLEELTMHTYKRSLKEPKKEMVVQSLKTNVWLAVANSCGNFIYAFAYWWGSKNILEGKASQTNFFIVLMAMLVSAQLWGQLFTLAPEISRAGRAMSRISGLLSLHLDSDSSHSSGISTPDTDDDLKEKDKDVEAFAEAPRPISPIGASIEFRDVMFSYPARPNIQVLDRLSLSIQPGQFCALVGPSGAGKSTVLALLERFYHPSSGSVFINGFDISRSHNTNWRDDIAYVPQDNVMFSGSIRFNLSLGARPNHNPTQEELEEACNLANVHDVIISLPQGYETDVGSGGSQLSGGQRQRLSIARALVRKPRLLLLDESTSALDAESERALEEGLERARRAGAGNGVTVIAIAHRLRTIAKADVIFMIEGGRVVDQGRHEELVERSESYRINALHQMLA
ncbi:leptomycin B resistance protein pmd1 [Lophiotrema nucula]|uniref:Leptomycin B resistance protein pmd1 n=1 Tax=Lophiotrema nucula TaxID=690887 RepID=A0A6A5YVD3_9PLEO|nr:leptomycin B resistance protein pmd1 [Lophiotrema nucula]